MHLVSARFFTITSIYIYQIILNVSIVQIDEEDRQLLARRFARQRFDWYCVQRIEFGIRNTCGNKASVKSHTERRSVYNFYNKKSIY
ncbi:unnamed protein product (macronuclear) [Paramecium tetraurelia]|uniref:Secreted protein n=1 Tax=Paramecium tetraurelia TaxID=5888 RepID=A0EAI0_PARTE|nr:uncharacterized protein GSPATT00025029001 [Paramecium tetraurelia]CAK92297.1 unnamed protein product [Paramecium tetraurelia]|eukprot:XP_001459694.1 hypothetical protein (macronuclear) [Paramecium tetraurelia strain d4-2]